MKGVGQACATPPRGVSRFYTTARGEQYVTTSTQHNIRVTRGDMATAIPYVDRSGLREYNITVYMYRIMIWVYTN